MGSGPPVILIHGAGGSAIGNWFVNGIAPALATTNRVIGIDMRAHGLSEAGPPDSRMNMSSDASAVELFDDIPVDWDRPWEFLKLGLPTGTSLRKARQPKVTQRGGALDGVKVLDFGQYIAGPLAAMLLADHGADVIHIDPPGGDRMESPSNAIWNRGKRRIALDLHEPGRRRGRPEARRRRGRADRELPAGRNGAARSWS